LMMGTVAYCAPEQISRGRADQRSDVYSSGIVMFELLTGQPPYQGESAMSVAYQHVHSRVPAPSSRVKGIPTEIDELVVCATDRDPESRPADAGAFLAELADVRTDLALPVVAVPPSPRTRARATITPAPARPLVADGATTDVFRRQVAGEHDTAIVHRNGPPQRPAVGPPPPVVTPPSRRRQASQTTVRRRRALIVLLMVILLGLAAGYGGWWFATGRYSHVPKVLGTTYAEASQDLRQAGYKVTKQPAPEFSESVPRDHVLTTQPRPNSRVPRGRTITVVLSAGPERFSLPKDVANKTPEQVKSQLASIPVNVAADLSPEASETIPEGRVTRISPAAGSAVKRGDEVKIYVSTGKPIISIPNVDPGTPYDQAAQTLKTAGFAATRVDEFSDTIAKDGVISLDPTGTARKGSTITLTVSKGPELVEVPKIAQGTSSAEARGQLKALGFKVKIVKHFGGILDEVVGMDPASGTMVPPGTLITLDVV
jgi:eukaryotic-like serine/threonine-protein kinase